jgi:hypothetical protein
LQISVLQGRHDDLEARYHALLSQPPSAPADCICGALMRTCDCPVTGPARSARTRQSRSRPGRA